MAAKETVPRGVIYCCVPLCHSYSGKVINGKAVKLHRLPKETKARRIWIARLRMCIKMFLQSLEHEFAACILKAKKARSRGVSFHLCSKPVQESLLRRNRSFSNRLRGSMTSSKLQTCQELAEYSSSTKQA